MAFGDAQRKKIAGMPQGKNVPDYGPATGRFHPNQVGGGNPAARSRGTGDSAAPGMPNPGIRAGHTQSVKDVGSGPQTGSMVRPTSQVGPPMRHGPMAVGQRGGVGMHQGPVGSGGRLSGPTGVQIMAPAVVRARPMHAGPAVLSQRGPKARLLGGLKG